MNSFSFASLGMEQISSIFALNSLMKSFRPYDYILDILDCLNDKLYLKACNLILEKGTAYITDIGMTGPKKSVIGMDVEVSLKRFETSLPEKYKVAEGKSKFNSCMFEIDDVSNKVKSITRINK